LRRYRHSFSAPPRGPRTFPVSRVVPAYAWLLLALAVLPLHSETRYEVDFADAASGRLHIEMRTTCERGGCELQMPIWNATYQVRDFVQFVEGFTVEDEGGQPVEARKVLPSRWRLEVKSGAEVRVRYEVLANRPGPFDSYAGADYASLNLGQILIYPVGQRRGPFSLRFRHKPRAWRAALALASHGGRYRAASYDELIDTPVLLAEFNETTFTHSGRPIRIVSHGDQSKYDGRELSDVARKVIAAATEIMGDVPFPSYLFVYHFIEGPAGGMEYRNGTSIHLPASCGTCELAPLTAHELFHAWNVKRIRPASLEPVDFTQPNVTPTLWFSEGVTSAYAQYILLKSGLTDESHFLDHVTRLITEYERRPASRAQTVEEASIETWLERYADYQRPERSVSYYLSGEIVGHLMDLTIRHYSDNKRSLDDVMRALNEQYAQRGRFFEDASAIQRLASEAAGRDLSEEFSEWLRTPGPFRWDRYLAFAGYRLETSHLGEVELGMSLTADEDKRVKVRSVEADGVAARAGFQAGDHLLALDGGPLTLSVPEAVKMLGSAPGQFTVEVDRDGHPRQLKVRPLPGDTVSYRIVEDPAASPRQKELRGGWIERRVAREMPYPSPSARLGTGLGAGLGTPLGSGR